MYRSENAKSAICAVLALGYLVGPLRRPGWRGAVASLSKEKAAELRNQIESIALASNLEGLRFRRAPYPGRVESETGALEILSSDRGAGHSSSFDLVSSTKPDSCRNGPASYWRDCVRA